MKTDQKTIMIPDFLIFLKEINVQPDQSVTNIQYATKITYSHLHNMKKILSEKGLISVEKKGVKNYLNLTETGQAVINKANELFALLGITDENISEFRRRGKFKNKEPVVEEKETEEVVEPELKEEVVEELVKREKEIEVPSITNGELDIETNVDEDDKEEEELEEEVDEIGRED